MVTAKCSKGVLKIHTFKIEIYLRKNKIRLVFHDLVITNKINNSREIEKC